jgi:4,5-dihydroxyphthalate decarboxylase
LFPDYVEVEKEYFRRTRIFPIMHTVVIKTQLYDEFPWIATSLMAGFEAAKEIGASRLRHTGALYCSLPWLSHHLEETDLVADGRELFAYGVDANRHVLERFLGYGLDQGLLEREVEVEELFATETI